MAKLPLRLLLLAALALTSGCALRQAALRAPDLPQQARADPARFLVITVRNEPEPAIATPGSTPRGYAAAGVYGVSASARAVTHSLERDYRLREVSAWPIESLRVNCILARLPKLASRSTLIARLSRDSRVESVQPLNEFATEAAAGGGSSGSQPRSAPRRTYLPLQLNLTELGVFQAHQVSEGAAVRIAVIDTGLDYGHPDLRGRIIARRDFVDPGNGDFSGDRHGTQVAGVIAATADGGRGVLGVAPESRLIALKACWPVRENAAEAACNSFTLAQALQAAITAHADIVNLSLAGPPDPLLARLVRYGMQQGIIYVGAVPPASGASTHAFPVDIPGVLGVQSAEDAGAGSRHLLAPGRGILTLVPGGHYDFASGSSLATAEVTGIVALLLADGRRLPAPTVERILTRSSRQVATPAGVLTSVNACAAVADALERADCQGIGETTGAEAQKPAPIRRTRATG
ncbi:MAG TPA: S8 family serine peptidase [Steroidobacteraceae bacterium]|nr:S8 family serine peptidase [Steroidobacteraceae bacterium]